MKTFRRVHRRPLEWCRVRFGIPGLGVVEIHLAARVGKDILVLSCRTNAKFEALHPLHSLLSFSRQIPKVPGRDDMLDPSLSTNS